MNVHFANRLLFEKSQTTWKDLEAEVSRRLGPADRYDSERIFFVVDDVRSALGVVVYGFKSGLDFGVIERTRLTHEVELQFAENGVRLIDASSSESLGKEPAFRDHLRHRVTVLTSGSTGLFKLIPHSSERLNTFARAREQSPQIWFIPYQIGSYAWYQMIALSLFVPGQDLIPAESSDLMGCFERVLRSGKISAISSTPTFWRQALLTIDEELLAQAAIKSISMGGEVVDQAILDRLSQTYPKAKIRHIYASSEAGAAIVVSDGRAGFSEELLDRHDGVVRLAIREGRLFVRSPYANQLASDDWVDTGDLVERREGRVYFCGRAGKAMINVGGQKAFAQDIEAHLMLHSDVAWAKVEARKAPLVGYLPVASVVLRTPMNFEAAETMLTAHCAGKLAEYAIPRMWEFLDAIPMQASLKS